MKNKCKCGCNVRVNKDRHEWKNYFNKLIEEKESYHALPAI